MSTTRRRTEAGPGLMAIERKTRGRIDSTSRGLMCVHSEPRNQEEEGKGEGSRMDAQDGLYGGRELARRDVL